MGDASEVEAQDPTPGEAQHSTSPPKEEAMQTATGSTGASTVSTQSNPNPEDAMSTDTSSTQGSTGASTASTQTNPNPEDAMSTSTGSTQSSTGASTASTQDTTAKEGAMSTSTGGTQSSIPSNGGSNGSTSTSSTSGSSTAPPEAGKEVKQSEGKKVVSRYLGTRDASSAEKLIKRVNGMQQQAPQAELDTAEGCYDGFVVARREVQGCVTTSVKARAERDSAVVALKASLLGAMWTLRGQTGGRAFAKGLEGVSDVKTAENILTSVPGSTYALSGDVLSQLRDQAQQVRDAEAAVTQAEKDEKDAALGYGQARSALKASTSLLRDAVKRQKYAARIAAVVKPARGSLRVAKSSSAHAKAKKKDS